MIFCGSLPLLPAASSPFVSALCPPHRPRQTPTRTDVDSCFQAPPRGRLITSVSFAPLSSAPGHPHLLEVVRDAGWLTDGAPSCWENQREPAWLPALLRRPQLPAFPVEKRKETAGLPARVSSTRRAPIVQI